MDPDSWPFLPLFISLGILGILFLCGGVLIEESTPKEVSDSKIGVSFKTVSAFLLCVPALVWAMQCVETICASLSALALKLVVNPVSSYYPYWAHTVIFIVSYILLALFSAILFVFLPMSWGRAHSETYLKKLKLPIGIISLFVPLARLVTMPARKMLLVRGCADEVGSITEEDVRDTVEELDEIDDTQKEMIGNIFELDDVKVADIMTHRTEIQAVSLDASIDDLVAISIEYGYSRIPVYDGNLDVIVGIAYVKDFLKYVGKSSKGIKLTKLIRLPLFVPEVRRARELLVDFKQKKMQLAVVVDEYGGTSGIVTMEDILESIVGDIEDEFDEAEEELIKVNADGTLTCDGYAEIEDVYDALGFDELPEEPESDTIGGLLTELLGRIPKRNEHPSGVYGNIKITAVKANERRITVVTVSRLDEENDENCKAT